LSANTYAAVNIDGAELVAARERLRITQGEAALDIGVNVATLRKWEKGTRHPQGAQAAQVARWIERSKTGPRRDEPIDPAEIVELRELLGMTQSEFGAKYGGAFYTSVSRWERGIVTPQRDLRERMRRDLRKAREAAEREA
jgi:DNA-binding transcriptional regulator YiaG